MATNFGKATLAALNAQAEAAAEHHAAQVERALAAAAAPLTARIEALTAGIADMQALLGAPQPEAPAETAPVVTPDPAPPSTDLPPPVLTLPPEPLPELPSVVASGYVFDVIFGNGTSVRIEPAPDTLYSRGIAQRCDGVLLAEVCGVSSVRWTLDVYQAGFCDLAIRNDGVMMPGGGELVVSVIGYLNGVEVLRQERDTVRVGTGRLYTLGTPAYGEMPTTADLIQQGLVAPYKVGPVVPRELEEMAQAMASADWRMPKSTRRIAQYMPGTGGRSDIGPATEPQAVFLMTRDDRALAYMIGQAEAAILIPWHCHDTARGHVLSALDYPRIWTDGRNGKGDPADPQTRGIVNGLANGQDGWSLDSAHMPTLCFIPFLMTGREVFRDEALAQGAWSIVNTWQDTRGPNGGGLVVVNGGQVRHSAWSLRQIDEAKVLALPGTYEAEYFEKASAANWAWLASKIPEWKEVEGEAHGWLPGDYGTKGALAIWQQAYMVTTTAAAARRGNADAGAFLRFQQNFFHGIVKRLGHDAAAYLIMVYGGDGKPLRTWKDIQDATVKAGWSNGTGWQRSQGDYGQLTVGALRLLDHTLGDPEAREMAQWLIDEGAPFTDASAYMRDLLMRIEGA